MGIELCFRLSGGFDELRFQVADWINSVKVLITSSISYSVFKRIFRLMLFINVNLNFSQCIMPLAKVDLIGFWGGSVFKIRRTGIWSEVGFERFFICMWNLLDIFMTNMSKISGHFLGEIGQLVGPGGEPIKYFFLKLKFGTESYHEESEWQPHWMCLALISPYTIKLLTKLANNCSKKARVINNYVCLMGSRWKWLLLGYRVIICSWVLV